ncbi:MAG: cytidine deaminase [Zavarzinella sp.]
MPQTTENEMWLQAVAVREFAHCPYSGFAVGACLESDTGELFTGCNVENATLGLTICAERVALVKAVSHGAKRFRAVCVVTDTTAPTFPCGACRQLLWEFGGDMRVMLGNKAGIMAEYHLQELFPHAFDGSSFTPLE